MSRRTQKTRFALIANLRTGERVYLADQRKTGAGNRFTRQKRRAWHHATADCADEHVARLHRVQANGGHWQNVQFFEVASY